MEQFQSEHVNEIYAALSKMQGELRPAIKDANNPFFKSKYADLSAIWECSRDALSKNGLCVSQSIMIQDGANVLLTILGHKSGQWIKSVAPIIAAKSDAQAFGSAVTYQRRYALSAIVGVSTEDDDGEGAVDRNKRAPIEVTPPKITGQQKIQLTQLMENIPEATHAGIFKWIGTLGFNSLADVTLDQFALVRNTLSQAVAKQKAEEEKSYV